MENYKKYIHSHNIHNLNAPNVVVPILLGLFNPVSVLDVGCGIGTWLNKFQELGVKDVIGIDGDYVERAQLKQYLDEKLFRQWDLREKFDLKRKFDLVLSLEVAEHLPATSAAGFVESICSHGDTVIFSAAIPHQGGQHHLNEQWQEFWVGLFHNLNYKSFDIIRPRIWSNPAVDWWYRQNIRVFSKIELKEFELPSAQIINAVHPDLYQQHVDYIIYLQGYVKQLEEKLYK